LAALEALALHALSLDAAVTRRARARPEYASVDNETDVEARPATDDIESVARKKADNLLSTLPFIGSEL
jgi:hypothetical protein